MSPRPDFPPLAEERSYEGRPASRSPRRFTLDGSASLEKHLDRTCRAVASEVGRICAPGHLHALLLGGGYGRGEGGVLRGARGDRPYNDLEFYVLVRENSWIAEWKYGRQLHALAERMTGMAGVEVEFKLLQRRRLQRSPASMFYYDLVSGHRRLLGDETALDGCEHHRDAGRIPLSEATRLLMNRCSGLLFSAEHLSRPGFGANEADFVGRNLAKAQLSFGDVLLTAHSQYHWSCVERHARLRRLAAEPGLPNDLLVRHHAAGVQFKLRPIRTAESPQVLAARHAEITAVARQLWLWLESRRLGRCFRTSWEYARARVNKCPETGPFKNRLLHLRTFGWRALRSSGASCYPRERLFHSLVLMLFEEGGVARGEVVGEVQRNLRTTARGERELIGAYQALWKRFN